MRGINTIRRWSSWLTLLAVLSACEKEQEQVTASDKEDAGAVDKTAQLDPSLAKAVAAASARPSTAPSTGQGGPPPNGIFAPGEADKELKMGAPAKITLGSQGEEPRYTLMGSSFHPRDKAKGTIQMAVQTDPRQGALPVDFALSFEAKVPPAPAANAPAAPQGATLVVATVTGASVAAVGLPPELATELAKLKGSHIEYLVSPNGAGSDFKAVPSKAGEKSGLIRTFNGLSDALAAMTLPYPDKPLGTGAFWMATTRENVMNLDTVTYRLIRVQRADPTQVTLTLETKRYAASTDFNVGVDGNWTLSEFQSAADGTAMLAHGQPFPFKGLLKLNFIAGVTNNDKPDEAGSLIVQGQARFTFDDLQDPSGKSVSAPAAAANAPAAAPAAAAPAAPAPPAPPAPAAQAPAP